MAERLASIAVGEWVHAVPYIEKMPYALAAADFAISRAGAMALAELCAWGIPSILVPLPHAAANHQHHNAVALSNAGAAVVLPEADFEPGGLWAEIISLGASDERRTALSARAQERGRPHAADKIVAELAKLLEA